MYKKYRNEHFILEYVARDLIGPANCIKDDIELPNSEFTCQLNKKYSPLSIDVNIVKYQKFSPYLQKDPSVSFDLLSSLSPSLTSPPLFSDSDFTLIGTNTNSITQNITLNDYTTLMKVYNYTTKLFDSLPDISPVTSSLDNNNFIYLPNSIVNYLNYLNDMDILLPNIDVNKINNLSNIANQFKLYLQGQLISIVKPSTDTFRLERDIVVIYDTTINKNIVNIQFNEIISWFDSDNILQNNKTTININTQYDYLIINSCADISDTLVSSIDNTINTYGNYLKIRNLVTDYHITSLLDKIKNLSQNNILYVNYYYNISTHDIGIQLVKRIDGNLVFINYFDTTPADPNVPFSYYKNICPNTVNNINYMGRCYSDCPSGYSGLGLSCVNNSMKNSLFYPNSNFCSQVCSVSDTDIRNFDPVLQKACWCNSVQCDKCNEFSIGQCKC